MELVSMLMKQRHMQKTMTCCPWSHGRWLEKPNASVAVRQLRAWFLAIGLLPRVSRQLYMSTNDKDDDVKPGAVHRSLAFKF